MEAEDPSRPANESQFRSRVDVQREARGAWHGAARKRPVEVFIIALVVGLVWANAARVLGLFG